MFDQNNEFTKDNNVPIIQYHTFEPKILEKENSRESKEEIIEKWLNEYGKYTHVKLLTYWCNRSTSITDL